MSNIYKVKVRDEMIGGVFMELNKKGLLEEIKACKVFSSVFYKASEQLQDILIKFVIESSRYSCNKESYVKNMRETSIRFQKPYIEGRKNQNYCMFTLHPHLNRILVDLRTDGIILNSSQIEIANLGNYYNGGFEWIRFRVTKEEDIDEAIKLISQCYKGLG